jgi:SH3-like domain-containing protein
MRFALFVAILFLCIVIGVVGSEVDTSAYEPTKPRTNTIVACDVGAYVIDHDPKGLNVRSGPGSSFSIVGNLPYRYETGVGVHITGSSGDWVRIDAGFEEGTQEERTLFKGVGWVYAPLLGLSGIAHQPEGVTPLYREPSQKSKVVKRVPGGDDVTVRGCRGEWFYVEYEKVKGWAAPRTLCNNPLTTCA